MPYNKNKNLKVVLILVALIVLIISFLTLSSCSLITSAVVGGAESGLSQAIYERVEQSVYKKMAPKEKLPPPATPGWNAYMTSQAYVIFSYTFTAGGFWLETKEYKEGEWTKFRITRDDGEVIDVEKALLKKLDNGNEWWRVSWKSNDGEWIYEALLNPENGKILRMKAKDADGNVGEVPVSEDSVFKGAQKLTKESLEGATVGEEKVKTPAGTFKAKHVEYMSMGSGKVEWWMTDKVPGGIIKYKITDENKKVVMTAVLTDYGKGAKTILGVY